MSHRILQINYLLFYFKRTNIGLFSNTVYDYAFHSAFQLKTQKIDGSK